MSAPLASPFRNGLGTTPGMARTTAKPARARQCAAGSTSGLVIASLVAALLAAPGCGDKSEKLKVTGLDPRTGDANGGTRLAVKGVNFQKTTRTVRIYFGDQQGTYLRTVDDETLLVEAPGGKAGQAVDVLVVFEPGGEITIPRAFTYIDRTPMRVEDLAPR